MCQFQFREAGEGYRGAASEGREAGPVDGQEAVRNTKLNPDLPITVLTRGVAYTNLKAAGISYSGMDLYEYEHRALQAKIAALSDNSEHRAARYATHLFNDTDPWIVIDEIKLLIRRLPKQ
jgi:hypothetical protein